MSTPADHVTRRTLLRATSASAAVAATTAALGSPAQARAATNLTAPAPDTGTRLFRELDEKIQAAMARYAIPGVAVGDRGDVTLHVRDSGSGIPVVLLHGWPDTGDLRRHQVPALAAAAGRPGGADREPCAVPGAPTAGVPCGVSDTVAAGDRTGNGRVEQRRPRAHRGGHYRLGEVRDRAVAVRAGRRRRALAATRRT